MSYKWSRRTNPEVSRFWWCDSCPSRAFMDKEEQYRRVFGHLYKNGDGKISPPELQTCIGRIGGDLSLEEAEMAVAMMDSDGDGLLSLEKEGGGCIIPKSLRKRSKLGESSKRAMLSGVFRGSTTKPASSILPNVYISTNRRFKHIAITHWQRGKLLGRGSFGSVYEGICDGGYFMAVKEVSLLDQGEQGKQSVLQLEQEIALLSQLEHENIVRYYGTDKDASKLYIFLELVTKGSLLSLYRGYHLQDCQVSSYTRQILHGLKYLHDQSVVHRDIKCANILVDANGSVKLADFGLAKVTKLDDVKSCKGTPFWMAPEVVNSKKYGYGIAADIWSLGCTVLEMLTRQHPYPDLEFQAAVFKIGQGIPPPIPDSLSREARDFISQCLHVNPRDRPTATQLLDHPFVSGTALQSRLIWTDEGATIISFLLSFLKIANDIKNLANDIKNLASDIKTLVISF